MTEKSWKLFFFGIGSAAVLTLCGYRGASGQQAPAANAQMRAIVQATDAFHLKALPPGSLVEFPG